MPKPKTPPLQTVLPMAEREANLARFLKQSAIKDRLYHGTTKTDEYADSEGQAFKQFTGRPTWLAADPYIADLYSEHKGSTYPLYSQIKKPLVIGFDADADADIAFPLAKQLGVDVDHLRTMKAPERAFEVINDPSFVDAAEKAGYDGFVINEGGYKTYGVFDPSKIKSAISNLGTYDPSVPDITKAQGGQVEHMQSGGVLKTIQAISKAAKSAGQESPVLANKNLTTLQDVHTSLGDAVLAKASEAQKQMDSWNYKYEPGQYVFTEHGAKNNLPPFRIVEKTRHGWNIVREDPNNPLSKKVIDPDTGKVMRTPYEPAYRVRRETGPDDWSEFIIPETAIKGAVSEAKGGAIHMQAGGIKSAIGNQGTYDITNPDITKAEGGQVHDAMVDKVKDPNAYEMLNLDLARLATLPKMSGGGKPDDVMSLKPEQKKVDTEFARLSSLLADIGKNREQYEKIASGASFDPRKFTPENLYAIRLLQAANKTPDPERYLESLNPYHSSQLQYSLDPYTNAVGVVYKDEPNKAVIKRLEQVENTIPHELTHTLQLGKGMNPNLESNTLAFRRGQELPIEMKRSVFPSSNVDNMKEFWANVNARAHQVNAAGGDFINSPEGRALFPTPKEQRDYYANALPGVNSITPDTGTFVPNNQSLLDRAKSKLGFAEGGKVDMPHGGISLDRIPETNEFSVNEKPASLAYTNFGVPQLDASGKVMPSPKTSYDIRLEQLDKELERGIKPDWMSIDDFVQDQVSRGRGQGHILPTIGKALETVDEVIKKTLGSSMGLDPMTGLIGKTGELHRVPGGARYAAGLIGPEIKDTAALAADMYLRGKLPGMASPASFAMSPEKAALRMQQKSIIDPQRMAFPGIYGNPAEIAAEAASRVAPESENLKKVFGITRNDLYEMGKELRGNLPGTLPGAAANPKGSAAAERVMTDKNVQRILDVNAEAEKHPELVKGMDPWYVMTPYYKRMVELLGPEKAATEYRLQNTLMGMASPGSEVITEIPRGSAAYFLHKQGRWPEFMESLAIPQNKREAAGVASDILNVPGHVYHRTAQAKPMDTFLRTGEMDMSSPKVPMYIEASGVPQIGFQTQTPVGDAHWSRAVGLADTRNKQMRKGQEIIPGASVSNPEMTQLAPWWRDKIAAELGIESVPAQARTWGAFSGQTGVTTPIGSPKLEMIADQIALTAKRLGVSLETARDMVMLGTARMGKKDGGEISIDEMRHELTKAK